MTTATNKMTKAQLIEALNAAQVETPMAFDVEDFMATDVDTGPIDMAELLTPNGPEKPVRTIAKQMAKYAPGYEPGINARGQKTLTTGDDLAHALLALTPEQTMKLAERLIDELEEGELVARYERLNPGQKRMNSGNQIRSRIKKGILTVDRVKEEIRKLNQ